MAEVILFEHANFHGAHKHLFASERNLAAGDDNFFNDITSSIVVKSGTWEFFRDSDFQDFEARLGPGLYHDVRTVGITNDTVSSVRRVGS